MLVLSRRQYEKVLIPDLGITIEVKRIKGRVVHLGIDAPDEIRIIRSELVEFDDAAAQLHQTNSCQRYTKSRTASDEIQARLDSARLAIRLAQNQLHQHLNEKAEEALEHALDAVKRVESTIEKHASVAGSTTVHESRAQYKINGIPSIVEMETTVGNSPAAGWLT